MFHMNIRTAMLAGSGLSEQGGVLHQNLGSSNVLAPGDDGGESGNNLSKGGSLWED